MKKRIRKLNLARETVQRLESPPALGQVVGALTAHTCYRTCPSACLPNCLAAKP